jgi:HTH-type transcriptional regulator/antitoxin MqsA
VKSSLPVCPVCDEGSLTRETYAEQIRHNGKDLTVVGLERCRCDSCDADPVLTDQIRRNQVKLCDARRRADGYLTGEEIRTLRDRFGLSQTDAAAMFGGGPNAFSKYERGEIVQSLSMDRLLRSVSAFPLLVDFLRRTAGLDASAASEHAQISVETREISLNDPNYTSKPIPGRSVHVSHQELSVVVAIPDWWKRAA